jgi:2,3-dihydroxyphenylpropionate 1,2-dioxygenase
MSAGIVGGAAVPHAPQFFTLPDTEDHDQVERMRVAMERVGTALLEADPDVVIIATNDHVENFFLHCVGAFTIHCGQAVSGSFGGRDFGWPVASDLSLDLVRRLQAESFDPTFTHTAAIGYEFGIPLTFCGIPPDMPLVPIYVNAYVPPQPSSERCFLFGRALQRSVQAAGVRAVMLASGGLSHFPGTDRYSTPDIGADDVLLERMRAGNLRALLGYDDEALDETGNAEVRSWQILAGALGDRKPDDFHRETSWHHDYALLAWTAETTAARPELHYPPVRAERIVLSSALFRLRVDREAREQFIADPEGYAAEYALDPDEREALLALDEAACQRLGVHALLGFLARLQVDIQRRATV